MNLRLWWALTLVSLPFLGVTPQIVSANVIKYELAVTITNFHDPDGLLAGLIAPTDSFHLTVTLDQSTKNPVSPSGAEYIAGLPTHSATMQFGTVFGVFTGTRTINGWVDNNSSLGRDVFAVSLSGPGTGTATGGSTLDPTFTLDGMDWGFSLEDDQATALTSNDLPLSIDVSQWERRPFGFVGTGSRATVDSGVFQLNGDIIDIVTTVIPVPPALYLFGSGLLGLVGISRRRGAA